MTNEAFEKGFAALTATFPSMNFNARLFWEMFNDLDGQFFLMAVWEFIKNTKDIFPGTNVIAILRARTIEIKHDHILKIDTESEKQRIERWSKEAVPMPEDCRKALAKLGAKLI